MRRRDPSGTKQLILEAAIKVFVQKGYTNTTIDDLVRESGVSKGGIYWHFKAKEEIFIYLLNQWMDDFYLYYQEIRTNEDNYENKLRTLVNYSFHQSGKNMILLGTEFWLHNLKDPEISSRLKEIYGRYQEMFRSLLFEGMVRGEFEAINIEDLTYSFMGLIEGVSSYQILMGQGYQSSDRTLMTGLEAFLKGIRKQREEESSC
jgi:AcrR family transcriptional regulator